MKRSIRSEVFEAIGILVTFVSVGVASIYTAKVVIEYNSNRQEDLDFTNRHIEKLYNRIYDLDARVNRLEMKKAVR